MNLGSSWRTPTYEEVLELKKNCRIIYASIEGESYYGVIFNSDVEGYKDKAIFIPVNSYFSGTELRPLNEYFLLTSSIYYDGDSNVYYYSFSERDYFVESYLGVPVRPVQAK